MGTAQSSVATMSTKGNVSKDSGKKGIIFVGKTGAGKSSLATMFSQGYISKDSNPLNVSDSAKGATLDCVRVSSTKYDVYDTVGLGEGQAGSVEDGTAHKLLKKFLKKVKRDKAFNYICIVMKSGRHDYQYQKIYDIVREIFKGAEQNIVLIVTDDIHGTWTKNENFWLTKIYGNIPKIPADIPKVETIFQHMEDDNVQRRDRSFKSIDNELDRLNYSGARPDICGMSDSQLDSLIGRVFAIMARVATVTIAGVSAVVGTLIQGGVINCTIS